MKNTDTKLLKDTITLQMYLTAFTYSPQAAPANGTYTTSLSNEMKTFYEMTLIEDAGAALVHGQFAEKYPIPRNGGKTIEFRKFEDLSDATTALTEGVTPDGSAITVSNITATVAQYGDFVAHTDMIAMTSIDPFVSEATKKLARQAGSTLDTVDRNVLISGTSVMYAPKISVSTETSVTVRSGLDSTAKLTVNLIMRAVAQLRANNVPTIDGDYVAIIHPYAAYDLMRDPEWIDAHKYAQPENLYKGEIGKIGGVRFVQSTKSKIWRDSTCPTNLSVFATLVFGSGAYATTEIEGGGLEMFVKQLGSSGSSDPLNQRATVGWKAAHVTEILHQNYMVRVESCSPVYSGTATAN